MKGGFPFAEAPSHRVLPGEIRPRPDAYQPKPFSDHKTPPAPDRRELTEEEMDALCMEAVEAAIDWRGPEHFLADKTPIRN